MRSNFGATYFQEEQELETTNESEDPLGASADRFAELVRQRYLEFAARWDSGGQSMNISLMETADGQKLLAERKRGEVMDLLKQRLPEHFLSNDAPDGNFAIQVIAKKDMPISPKLKSLEKLSPEQASSLAYGS